MSVIGDAERTSSVPCATPLHLSRLVTPEAAVPRETPSGDVAFPQQTPQDSVSRASGVFGARSTAASRRSFRDIPAFVSPQVRRLREDLSGENSVSVFSSSNENKQAGRSVEAVVRQMTHASYTQMVLPLPNIGGGSGSDTCSAGVSSRVLKGVDAEPDASARSLATRLDSGGGTLSSCDTSVPDASVPTQGGSLQTARHSPRNEKGSGANAPDVQPLAEESSGQKVREPLAGVVSSRYGTVIGDDIQLASPLRVLPDPKASSKLPAPAGPITQQGRHQEQVIGRAAASNATHEPAASEPLRASASSAARAQPGDGGDEGGQGFWDEDDLDEWRFDDTPPSSCVERRQPQPPAGPHKHLDKPATLQRLFDRADGCPAPESGKPKQLETALGSTPANVGIEGMLNGIVARQDWPGSRVNAQQVVECHGGGGGNAYQLQQMQGRPVSASHRSIEDLFA